MNCCGLLTAQKEPGTELLMERLVLAVMAIRHILYHTIRQRGMFNHQLG